MLLDDFDNPTPLLVSAVKGIKPGRILDIGCGNGRNAIYLARLGWEVVALDANITAVNYVAYHARKLNLNIKVLHQSIISFDTSETYAAIVCLMVLHYLTKPEITRTVAWMRAQTNSGGLNIISSYNQNNPVGTRPYLFEATELMNSYNDWQIITSQENASSSVVKIGETCPTSNQVSRLVAKKP